MREVLAATTQRNQVTIPAEVRRLLGLKPRDKVAFTIEDDGVVRLAAVSFSLESAYGSVKPVAEPVDLEQAIEDARDDKAERTVRELAEA